MRTLDVVAAALVGAVVLFGTRPAAAQFGVIDRIRKEATDKAKAKKAQADSAVVARAGRTVDSTLEKTGRGVDTAVAKVGTVTDTMLNRSERGVKSLAGGRRSDDAARLAADLADDGRVVLEGLRFGADGALDAASRGTVRALAKLLQQSGGGFVVEGHVAPGGDPAAEQARSESRAKAVKAALVEEGLDVSRLFALALGSARPPVSGHSADRIEVARMQ
ncbi:MAG TPA: OmpA family protein [Gemmatimonadaceae bacterium]|nr:OmpA family protein [Gemmatimonadaceae bacterium]